VSPDDTWSPDEQSGTEVFEEGDEALDERERTDPDFLESIELDPSLDPTLLLDERELEEVGATLDDPESIATLDGGIDDPDGIDPPPKRAIADDEGWDLDAPLAKDDDDDESG
jgi:hypothetical protein